MILIYIAIAIGIANSAGLGVLAYRTWNRIVTTAPGENLPAGTCSKCNKRVKRYTLNRGKIICANCT